MKDILEMFVSEQDDDTKTWSKKPFTVDDKSYATDYHAMVIMPAQDGVGEIVGYSSDKALSVIPKDRMPKKSVSLSELKEIVGKAERKKEYPSEKCNACDGYGEVDAPFEYKNKNYTLTGDCPVCNGEGTWDIKTAQPKEIVGEGEYIKIGISYFMACQLDRILKACDIIGCNELTITHQTEESKLSIFDLTNGVEVLLMPCAYEVFHNQSLLGEIQLN